MKTVYVHDIAFIVFLPLIVFAPYPLNIVLALVLFVILHACVVSGIEDTATSYRQKLWSLSRPAHREPAPFVLHTDKETGNFFVSTDDRAYEFRGGAGCDVSDISAKAIRSVTEYMDKRKKTTESATFFEVLGRSMTEEEKRK
jgi:hypothetical protein